MGYSSPLRICRSFSSGTSKGFFSSCEGFSCGSGDGFFLSTSAKAPFNDCSFADSLFSFSFTALAVMVRKMERSSSADFCAAGDGCFSEAEGTREKIVLPDSFCSETGGREVKVWPDPDGRPEDFSAATSRRGTYVRRGGSGGFGPA